MNSDNDKIKNKQEKEEKKIEKQESDNKDTQEKEKLKQKIEELENSYKRALADYQNLEKRTIEERKSLIVSANRQLLLRLLPVLDTLMIALQHNKDKGLALSVNQFLDTLKAEGVEKIETKGKTFDPKIMECVEAAEGEEGKISEEVLAGYLLNNELLRPAMVKVGKKEINKKEEELVKKELQN